MRRVNAAAGEVESLVVKVVKRKVLLALTVMHQSALQLLTAGATAVVAASGGKRQQTNCKTVLYYS